MVDENGLHLYDNLMDVLCNKMVSHKMVRNEPWINGEKEGREEEKQEDKSGHGANRQSRSETFLHSIQLQIMVSDISIQVYYLQG